MTANNDQMEALKVRIEALEQENKELRDQNQTLSSSNNKLVPRVPRRLSDDGGEGKVYFDGHRTRVGEGVDGWQKHAQSQNNDGPPPTREVQKFGLRTMSSLSSIDVDSSSESELDSYLESKFRADDSARSGESENKRLSSCTEEQPQGTNSRNSKRVSFGSYEQDANDTARPTLGPRGVSIGGIGPSIKNGTATSIENNNGDKHEFRRSSMLINRRWSEMTLSTTGEKVHFTLGKNRYSLKVEEILKKSSSRQGVDNEVMGANQVEDTAVTPSRSMLTKSKTGSNVMKIIGGYGETTLQRKSCPSVSSVSKDIEVFKRISNTLSMCKLLSQRMLIEPTAQATSDLSHQNSAFDQFFLFSVNVSNCEIQDRLDRGVKYLDPFILKSAGCVDEYPCHLTGDNFAPEDLSAFCVGDGLKIRLIPKYAATRLKWTGPDADQYKLLAFTDGNGMTTHGVAITVASIVSTSEPGYHNFIRNLQLHRAQHRATNTILGCWRSYLAGRKNDEVSLNAIPEMSQKSTRMGYKRATIDNGVRSQRSKSGFKRASLDHGSGYQRASLGSGNGNRRRRDARFRSSLTSSIKASATTLKKKIPKKPKPFKKKGKAVDDAIVESARFETMSSSDYSELCFESEIEEELPRPPSERARELGRESYKVMQLASSMGDLLVVEKCYVLIGGEQSEQYLKMKALSELVKLERESSKQETSRHKHLSMIKSSMVLSPSDAVQLPNNDLDILNQPPFMFEVDAPGLNSLGKMSIPLPLPQIAEHWAVAAMVHHLTVTDFFSIIHLLLIERSVLVIGPSSELVTTLTCALLDLIRPFQWASNFMPILPLDCLDFVNSPCPFIIGMVAENRTQSEKITDDARVKEALNEGVSVINLGTDTVHLTTEPGIQLMVQNCPSPK